MDPQTPQPPVPAPGPQVAPTAPVVGGKKMNKGLLAGIIVAVVLLLAGAAWVVYALFFTTTPESLMKDAIKNLSQENTVALDFDVDVEGVGLVGKIAATADAANKNGEVIVTFGEGSDSLVLSLLTVDDSAFLKAANLEQMASFLALYTGNSSLGSPQFMDKLKEVNGNWYEITKEQLDSFAESTGSEATTTVSPEDLKKALQIYEQHPFVKPDKVFTDESVNGAQSAHFSVKVDQQEQAKFFDALQDANLATIQLTDEDVEKLKETTDSSNATIEVWVARSTKKFTKFLVTGESEGQSVNVILTASPSAPAFDDLERPADARPISELMSLLFGSSLNLEDLEPLDETSGI